jgi:BirA family biotin operon repressor/biotin-[acetyl-CoA-carboxylase] ligase
VFSDLTRPGLREPALRRGLLVPGGRWTDVRVVTETGSTNADVAVAARAGAPAGLVLVAERQLAGRGRLGRPWSAPARAALTFSMLLRPEGVPLARWGWFPLLTGLAVLEPLNRLGELEVGLKWPNDVLVGERKLAGILAERVGDALVVGVGLNVSLRADELPVPTATSLTIEGAQITDRDPLLRALLRSLAAHYDAFVESRGAPAPVADAYRSVCVTLGRDVRIALPGDRSAAGTAVDVDDNGALVVDTGTGHGPESFTAGDVVHVR